MDRTEVTIGEFRRFAEATNFHSQAEQEGGTAPVEPEPGDTDDGGFLPGFSSTMGIISMLGAAILVAGRRKD